MKKLEELIEGEDLIAQGSAIQATDLMQYVRANLSTESQAILEKKVTQTTSSTYSVRYFGFRDSSMEIVEAGKKLAAIINEVCGAYQVVGCLAEPIKIDLYFDDSTKVLQSIYVCYLAFTPEAAKVIDRLIKLDKQSIFFHEGGAPSEQE